MAYCTCTLNCKSVVLRFTGNTVQLYWGRSRRHMPTHWFPNSAAMKRKPDFRTHMLEATGTVSKYFRRISVTWNITMSKYFWPICHLKCHSVKVLQTCHLKCHNVKVLQTYLSHEMSQCQCTSDLSVTWNTTVSKYFRPISVIWNIILSKYYSVSFETSYCQSTTLSHETSQCQKYFRPISVPLNTTLSKYFRCICHLKYHSVKVLQT